MFSPDGIARSLSGPPVSCMPQVLITRGTYLAQSSHNTYISILKKYLEIHQLCLTYQWVWGYYTAASLPAILILNTTCRIAYTLFNMRRIFIRRRWKVKILGKNNSCYVVVFRGKWLIQKKACRWEVQLSRMVAHSPLSNWVANTTTMTN